MTAESTVDILPVQDLNPAAPVFLAGPDGSLVGHCSGAAVTGRLRLLRRPAQRRQVDPDQRDHRAEDRDHQQPPADHPAHRAGRAAPRGRAAGAGRHAWPAQTEDAARRAPQRPGPRDLERGRRGRALPAGRRGGRAGTTGSSPARLAGLKAAVVAVVTKTDLVDRGAGWPSSCSRSGELADFADIVPVSAVSGDQLDVLVDVMIGPPARLAPALPRRHDHRRAGAGDGGRADPGGCAGGGPRRAAALDRRDRRGDARRTRIARSPRSTPTSTSSGTSQKAIVIGAGGTRLREVGTRARAEIEELLGTRVYLDLHVRVAKEWQRDPEAAASPRLLTFAEDDQVPTRLPLYRDDAVVLRVQKLGETDRIITLLTREHGRVRAAAKGSPPHDFPVRGPAGAVRPRRRPAGRRARQPGPLAAHRPPGREHRAVREAARPATTRATRRPARSPRRPSG